MPAITTQSIGDTNFYCTAGGRRVSRMGTKIRPNGLSRETRPNTKMAPPFLTTLTATRCRRSINLSVGYFRAIVIVKRRAPYHRNSRVLVSVGTGRCVRWVAVFATAANARCGRGRCPIFFHSNHFQPRDRWHREQGRDYRARFGHNTDDEQAHYLHGWANDSEHSRNRAHRVGVSLATTIVTIKNVIKQHPFK